MVNSSYISLRATWCALIAALLVTKAERNADAFGPSGVPVARYHLLHSNIPIIEILQEKDQGNYMQGGQ